MPDLTPRAAEYEAAPTYADVLAEWQAAIDVIHGTAFGCPRRTSGGRWFDSFAPRLDDAAALRRAAAEYFARTAWAMRAAAERARRGGAGHGGRAA